MTTDWLRAKTTLSSENTSATDLSPKVMLKTLMHFTKIALTHT